MTASGRPELARGDPALQLDVLRPEPQHEPDHEDPAAALGRGQDRLAVLERQRERLLEEDVLACREGLLRDLAMEGVGRQMSTASISGSASTASRSVETPAPTIVGDRRAFSAVRENTVLTRTRSPSAV